MKKSYLAIPLIAASVVLVGCTGEATNSNTNINDPGQAVNDVDTGEVFKNTIDTISPTTKETTTNQEKDMDRGEMAKKAVIETSKGEIQIGLYTEKAPKTTQNFIDLIEKGFYDGLIFHRVIEGFMVQGGDPNGNGSGGPGYEIEDEFDDALTHSKKGILSMANRGPNTGGSQFFITLAETPWLDGKHAVFGEVISGEDVLMEIGTTETALQDKPVEDIVMKSVRVADNTEE